MKHFAAIFSASVLLAIRAAMAQDANAVPLPPDPNAPSAEPTPVPLFPSDTPPAPVDRPHSSGGGSSHPEDARYLHGVPQAPKKKSTADSQQEIADRIKFREAKTKALRDPQIQAEQEKVDAAKTDQEKRAALKRYYTLFYAKILKIDGSLKKLVADRQKDSLKLLDQSRVRPEDYPQEASTR